MASKLELEDYKAFSYKNEIDFENYLNSVTEDLLPIQIQGLLDEFSGLSRIFLSKKDRYVVSYCFECDVRNFE